MNNYSLFADALIEASKCENEQDKKLCFCKAFIETMQKTTPERLCCDLMDVVLEGCYPFEESSRYVQIYFKRERSSVFSVSFDFTHSFHELEGEISFLKKRKARLMRENRKLEDEKRKLEDCIYEKREEIEHYKELKEDFSRLEIFTETKL